MRATKVVAEDGFGTALTTDCQVEPAITAAPAFCPENWDALDHRSQVCERTRGGDRLALRSGDICLLQS